MFFISLMKIKRANANPEGLKNLKMIGSGIGIDVDSYEMNIDLKMAISNKMKELFNI